MNKPLLIIQGKNDLAVPVSEVETLYSWSDKELTELHIISAAGHTFDVKHPFEGSNKKFDSVLEKTNYFFKTNLI
jgi:dienelactone hydrolase